MKAGSISNKWILVSCHSFSLDLGVIKHTSSSDGKRSLNAGKLLVGGAGGMGVVANIDLASLHEASDVLKQTRDCQH